MTADRMRLGLLQGMFSQPMLPQVPKPSQLSLPSYHASNPSMETIKRSRPTSFRIEDVDGSTSIQQPCPSAFLSATLSV